MIKYKNLLSHIKIEKENLMFSDIEIEKINFTGIRLLFFKKDVDIEKVLVSSKISSGKIAINTLLVNCIMIIKLSHYI